MKIFIFFCNTFNLEDDCFVHKSVASFVLHQNAKNHPWTYPTKLAPKNNGQKNSEYGMLLFW